MKMWTTIWILLVIFAIVTPIYLLYKLFVKLIKLGKTIGKIVEKSSDNKYVFVPKTKNSSVSNLCEINNAFRIRSEIRKSRAERRKNRLEHVIDKWERYGLIDD